MLFVAQKTLKMIFLMRFGRFYVKNTHFGHFLVTFGHFFEKLFFAREARLRKFCLKKV